MGINGNMIKHYKTKAYTIEQYDANIASILMRKPYDYEGIMGLPLTFLGARNRIYFCAKMYLFHNFTN